MTRYNGDPYWTTARFDSVCTCGRRIKRGQRIYYFPKGKKALCEPCGKPASDRFEAESWDEDMYNRNNPYAGMGYLDGMRTCITATILMPAWDTLTAESIEI